MLRCEFRSFARDFLSHPIHHHYSVGSLNLVLFMVEELIFCSLLNGGVGVPTPQCGLVV